MAKAELELYVHAVESHLEDLKEEPGEMAMTAVRSAHLQVDHHLRWHIHELAVGSKKAAKKVLRGIKGEACTGQLLGLLGPSGAGKTSLLECLALRNRSFVGSVQLDGQPMTGQYFTLTAMVHQKELLFGFMTIREHLTFHAISRMGCDHGRKAIEGRVEEVIRETRLYKCADTIIGGTDPIYMFKGISGGERKRVALATELLRCPAIIFLDEPTSGLDSVMAESVLSTLKDLTTRGRMVITSLHCPSSDIVKYFTHLVLLTHDGRLAYHGERTRAVSHFVSLGYAYPADYNPADYLLKVCSRAKEDVTLGEAAAENKRISAIVDAFDNSSLQTAGPLEADDGHKGLRSVVGVRTSSWTLFALNYWRFWIQVKRDLVTYGLWTAVSIMIGVMFGVLYYKQAGTSWRNLLGLAFSLVVSSLLISSMSMVVRLPLDWAVVQREYIGGSNTMGPYLMARSLSTWPYLIAPFLMATTIYWMTGMTPETRSYFEFTGISISVTMASISLGVLVSALSSNIFICLSTLPGIITPMILFSGLLYEKGSVPVWLSWIENVSIINYGFSAIMMQQGRIMQPATRAYLMHFLGLGTTSVAYNVWMMWVLIVAFQILTYIVLKVRFSLEM